MRGSLKHIRLYSRYIHELRLKYGLKHIVMVLSSHFIKKEIPYKLKSSRTGNIPVYVRMNTSDIQLVNLLLLDNGEYDFLKKPPFCEIVRTAKTFIDAGANIGLFTRILLNQNEKLEGYCIEPERSNVEVLKKNTKSFGRIIIIEGALWNKNCNLSIMERNGGSHVSFTVEECNDNEEGNIRAYEVSSLNLENIDIFKIDIEGSEYEVFDDSCEKWIDKVSMIIIEFHDRFKPGCTERVSGRLKKHGFVESVFGENHIFIKE